MIAVNEITTYREGNMFWADATGVVDVSAASAWMSLDVLLMRIIEIPPVGGSSVRIRRIRDNVPVMYVGNKFVARAAMLGGIIKSSLCMQITELDPPKYLRLAIHTFNMHFADADFRIESVDAGSRLTYRQGFRSRGRSSGQSGGPVDMKAREMPETARIFNLWVEIAHTTGRTDMQASA
jgi:hypothetical protein